MNRKDRHRGVEMRLTERTGKLIPETRRYGARLGPGDFVLDEDPVAPSPKGGRTPNFSAHGYCDQTAGWMNLVLGMVVGLSPGEFVLDGDPAPSPKGTEPPPQF